MADLDLRDRPFKEQEWALAAWPHPLGIHLKEVDQDQDREVGPGLWTDSQRSAVDAAVLILRAMALHTDQRLVDEARKTSTQSGYKAILALVDYSWLDCPATPEYMDGDGDPSGAVAEGQIELYKALRDWEGLRSDVAQPKDLDVFMSLMESPEMQRYLWSRVDLQFWSGKEILTSADGKKEKRKNLTMYPTKAGYYSGMEPAILPGDIQKLDARSLERDELLAKSGLIIWNGDVPLEDYLAKIVVAWKETDGTRHEWISEWTRDDRCPPTILRIQFTPGKLESWSGFDALASLAFFPPVLAQRDKEGPREQRFNLVAVVRLANTARECTHVRVYCSELGEALCPKELQARKPAHVNDKWKLGEVGHSYMLYYVQSDDPPTDPPQEVKASEDLAGHLFMTSALDKFYCAEKEEEKLRHHKLAQPASQAARPGGLSPPLNAPTGPRADRGFAPGGVNSMPIGTRKGINSVDPEEETMRNKLSKRDIHREVKRQRK